MAIIQKIFRGLVAQQLTPTPSSVPVYINPFKTGDWVKLKRENPWKGFIRSSKAYEVRGVLGNHINIEGDNGRPSHLMAKYFQLSEHSAMSDASNEYDDAIAAQEAYDALPN